MLTIGQVSERYGVTGATVLTWIARGELRAINVGRGPAKKRPRWRITPEALAEFELARSSNPTPAPKQPPRRKRVEPMKFEFVKYKRRRPRAGPPGASEASWGTRHVKTAYQTPPAGVNSMPAPPDPVILFELHRQLAEIDEEIAGLDADQAAAEERLEAARQTHRQRYGEKAMDSFDLLSGVAAGWPDRCLRYRTRRELLVRLRQPIAERYEAELPRAALWCASLLGDRFKNLEAAVAAIARSVRRGR